MARGQFKWVPGGAAPKLERHSNAKLDLLELYLRNYFDTVVVDPAQERIAISFVDGFSGGGKYTDRDGQQRSGSPFVLLNAAAEAGQRLNRGRVKPLTIAPRFYFVDSSRGAVDYLRAELERDGYADALKTGEILLFKDQFEAISPKIIEDIKSRHRGGRSIFVLDQKGWSAVQFLTIRTILETLPRAEVILTFAVDWLMAYLNDGEEFKLALAKAGFGEAQIRRYIEARGLPGYRYIIPRLLRSDIQQLTGAAFFSPFFLRSSQADRDLWVIHLSKLTTARNVMVASHWQISNAAAMTTGSIHQGPAGLKMLGFDPHWEDALPMDFTFNETAEAAISTALGNELPQAVAGLDDGDPPTIEFLGSQLANHTAATKEQLETVLVELHRAGELDLLTPNGGRKRGASLSKLDRVRIPRQGKLFTF
ncbi:MAG: hypothetical protein JWQ89_3908 [Devosia sp.]|uniref:three-Cys-motif partner protein TcmP n=1 Tax=Devosia sp. TaxID=1871048 RepID=UPI002628086F|nr:three-Cys-motif partner protein TcmP [Devosia sp.]MDB5542181.1 hypothetical protein [Devosia sp.]